MPSGVQLSEKSIITIERSNSNTSQQSTKQQKSSLAEQLGTAKNTSYDCCGVSVSIQTVKMIKTVSIFTALILGGGVIFSLLESPGELEKMEEVQQLYKQAINDVMALLGNNQTLFDALQAANGEIAFGKEPTALGHWTFTSSSMFAFTVVTTIGKSWMDHHTSQ